MTLPDKLKPTALWIAKNPEVSSAKKVEWLRSLFIGISHEDAYNYLVENDPKKKGFKRKYNMRNYRKRA